MGVPCRQVQGRFLPVAPTFAPLAVSQMLKTPLSGFPSTSSSLCSLGMSTPPKDLFWILFQTLMSLSWRATPSWGSKDACSLKTLQTTSFPQMPVCPWKHLAATSQGTYWKSKGPSFLPPILSLSFQSVAHQPVSHSFIHRLVLPPVGQICSYNASDFSRSPFHSLFLSWFFVVVVCFFLRVGS